jgi:hypothetical protein
VVLATECNTNRTATGITKSDSNLRVEKLGSNSTACFQAKLPNCTRGTGNGVPGLPAVVNCGIKVLRWVRNKICQLHLLASKMKINVIGPIRVTAVPLS